MLFCRTVRDIMSGMKSCQYFSSRRTLRSVAICSLAITTSISALCQTTQPSIKVGDLDVKLGVPADGVVAALQKGYSVQFNDKSPANKWYVSTEKNGMPFAVIYARGNSVAGVESLVGNREVNSAQDIFDALFTATSKLYTEGRNSCAVAPSTEYSGGLSKAVVFLTCGVYQFRLQRNEFKSNDGQVYTGYMVWESLGSTD